VESAGSKLGSDSAGNAQWRLSTEDFAKTGMLPVHEFSLPICTGRGEQATSSWPHVFTWFVPTHQDSRKKSNNLMVENHGGVWAKCKTRPFWHLKRKRELSPCRQGRHANLCHFMPFLHDINGSIPSTGRCPLDPLASKVELKVSLRQSTHLAG
jgi:hypothetical protein